MPFRHVQIYYYKDLGDRRMRILWITNIMLPPICEAMNFPVPSVGGWMYSSLKQLQTNFGNQYAVATIYKGKEFISKDIDGITYYLLPLKGKSFTKYNRHLESFWKEIKESFKPDVVHIHGSEYPHGLAYVKSCGPENVILSIQGIISCIARYYTADLPAKELGRNTLRDVLRCDGILDQKKTFEKRGNYEIDIIKHVTHIIGRTDWDKAHVSAINPKAHYHYCGETLRDAFYKNKWDYKECEPHSIFVSQANYPIKGLHMLLNAMPFILRKYPDTMLYVAGSDPTSLPFWRITGYGKYLLSLIKKLNLREHIVFTGSLDEEAMCRRYLKSNIFVCCSSIENSSNSIGEAQLLRMPYVASFVGGNPEIVGYYPEALYRFEEVEMLAERICAIFETEKHFQPFPFDKDRYSGDLNSKHLLSIYHEIVGLG